MAYDYAFEIPVPDQDTWDRIARKFDDVRAAHLKVSRRVLGHAVAEADWLIFDDILTLEYDRLVALMKLLDEKAG